MANSSTVINGITYYVYTNNDNTSLDITYNAYSTTPYDVYIDKNSLFYNENASIYLYNFSDKFKYNITNYYNLYVSLSNELDIIKNGTDSSKYELAGKILYNRREKFDEKRRSIAENFVGNIIDKDSEYYNEKKEKQYTKYSTLYAAIDSSYAFIDTSLDFSKAYVKENANAFIADLSTKLSKKIAKLKNAVLFAVVVNIPNISLQVKRFHGEDSRYYGRYKYHKDTVISKKLSYYKTYVKHDVSTYENRYKTETAYIIPIDDISTLYNTIINNSSTYLTYPVDNISIYNNVIANIAMYNNRAHSSWYSNNVNKFLNRVTYLILLYNNINNRKFKCKISNPITYIPLPDKRYNADLLVNDASLIISKSNTTLANQNNATLTFYTNVNNTSIYLAKDIIIKDNNAIRLDIAAYNETLKNHDKEKEHKQIWNALTPNSSNYMCSLYMYITNIKDEKVVATFDSDIIETNKTIVILKNELNTTLDNYVYIMHNITVPIYYIKDYKSIIFYNDKQQNFEAINNSYTNGIEVDIYVYINDNLVKKYIHSIEDIIKPTSITWKEEDVKIDFPESIKLYENNNIIRYNSSVLYTNDNYYRYNISQSGTTEYTLIFTEDEASALKLNESPLLNISISADFKYYYFEVYISKNLKVNNNVLFALEYYDDHYLLQTIMLEYGIDKAAGFDITCNTLWELTAVYIGDERPDLSNVAAYMEGEGGTTTKLDTFKYGKVNISTENITYFKKANAQSYTKKYNKTNYIYIAN